MHVVFCKDLFCNLVELTVQPPINMHVVCFSLVPELLRSSISTDHTYVPVLCVVVMTTESHKPHPWHLGITGSRRGNVYGDYFVVCGHQALSEKQKTLGTRLSLHLNSGRTSRGPGRVAVGGCGITSFW